MIRVQVEETTAKSKLEHTIRDTEFYEQFEFQVQAINALGQGPRSEIVYGHSGEKCRLSNCHFPSPVACIATNTARDFTRLEM